MQVHREHDNDRRAGEEEKIFISSVPLIPNRICSTENLKAPDDIPNIIYTGAKESNRCYRVLLHRR